MTKAGYRSEVKREYDLAYYRNPDRRGTCQRCGGMMGIHVYQDGTCRKCRREMKEERWKEMETAWAEGMSIPEIAEAAGITRGHVSAIVQEMRRAGRDMPLRSSNGGWA